MQFSHHIFRFIRNNLANALTMMRVLLLPVLSYQLITQNNMGFFWIAVISMGTDAIDGTIARILGSESVLGRRLDSIADFCFYPVFAIGSLYLLQATRFIPFWQLVLILSIPIVTTFIVPLILIRRITFLHLRTWQISSYSFLLFVVVSFLSGQFSTVLFYLCAVMFAVAGLEETCIYIRDGKNTDGAVHSYFERRPVRS